MSILQEDTVTALDSGNKPVSGVIVDWTPRRQAFFQTKYCFDLWLGRLLLVLFSPLILALWLLVVLTSRGPGFYRQTRTGLNGRDFNVIKLRSMVWNAEVQGVPVLCCKRDSRMTWLGGILRKLHLDELPQLVNVARGEMSLVGPRPERPTICEDLALEVDGYFDRVAVKPGITGLSQINLPPDETWGDVQRKQVLDLTYINESNWWLEFRILVATALRLFGIKGVVAMRSMALCRSNLLKQMGLSEKPNEELLPFAQSSSKKRKLAVVKIEEDDPSCFDSRDPAELSLPAS